MYCATFYSYKGGVGRTLALANVAAHLATRRKRVLVVDFDLEAPGLATLDICSAAQGKPGVVNFIHSYLETGAAPLAQDFIHDCEFVDRVSGDTFSISVMPAGDQTASYGADFAKIDWRALYNDHEGFLLIEDLREQWEALGYDYVLIDSRTGLTDVSGICTRQLPDGVVMVFFPNEQNLIGLREMAAVIRDNSARPKVPELLFVASRLPKLDDENSVLERWLDRFKAELQYSDQQLSALDQYDSLALLDQEIFVLSRPRTGLAKQYRAVSDLLSQLNDSDAQGAYNYIESISSTYSSRVENLTALLDRSNPFSYEHHETRLEAIEERHLSDARVQLRLADHYYNLRDFAKLEIVLRNGLAANAAAKGGMDAGDEVRARLLQLSMRMNGDTGESLQAAEAARQMLHSRGATERMVVEAIMLLITVAPGDLPAVTDIAYLQEANAVAFRSLMDKVGISSREADFNSEIAKFVVERFGDNLDSDLSSVVQLALVAGGKFDTALSVLGDSDDIEDLRSLEVPDAFNRTMALWGKTGRPNVGLVEEVLRMALASEEKFPEIANYQQCLALLYAILGDQQATLKRLKNAVDLLIANSGRREVSCWSFIEEPVENFVAHSREIIELSKGIDVKPRFMLSSDERKLIRTEDQRSDSLS